MVCSKTTKEKNKIYETAIVPQQIFCLTIEKGMNEYHEEIKHLVQTTWYIRFKEYKAIITKKEIGIDGKYNCFFKQLSKSYFRPHEANIQTFSF